MSSSTAVMIVLALCCAGQALFAHNGNSHELPKTEDTTTLTWFSAICAAVLLAIGLSFLCRDYLTLQQQGKIEHQLEQRYDIWAAKVSLADYTVRFIMYTRSCESSLIRVEGEYRLGDDQICSR
jgi:hypothetical protein